MCTSRAPARRIRATVLGVVVPRTILSSTTTTRLPLSTSGSGLNFSFTPDSGRIDVDRARAILVHDEDLATLHVAQVLGSDGAKRAGLRRDDPGAAQPAEAERSDPIRVADGDQGVRSHHDQAVGALDQRH